MNQRNAWISPQFIHIQQDWELSFISLDELPIIIGLTGPTKSGKTMVANRLVTLHNFQYENLSSIITEIAQQLGKNLNNWEELGKLAILLRKENGGDYLARCLFNKMMPKILRHSRFIIDGVLHHEEVAYLQKKGNFHLIGFEVSIEKRKEQAKKWYPDKISEEYISKRDKFEQVYEDSGDKNAPNIGKCMCLANFVMKIDDFTDEIIYKQADSYIQSILNP